MIDMKNSFDIQEIEGFAQKATKFTIPQVQAEFGLTYAKARAAVDDMVARKLVQFKGGLTFVWKSNKGAAFEEVQNVRRRVEMRRDFKRLHVIMDVEDQPKNWQRPREDDFFTDARMSNLPDAPYPDDSFSEAFAYALNNPLFYWEKEKGGAAFFSPNLRFAGGRPFEFKLIFHDGDYYISDGDAAFEYLCEQKSMRQEAALKAVGDAAKKHGLTLVGHSLELLVTFSTVTSDAVRLYLAMEQLFRMNSR